MRGKQRPVTACVCARGITPAHAGKTIDKDGVIVIGQDHPRACGENLVKQKTVLPRQGSPPRMRGKQPPSGKSIDKHRITPAHAGKTLYCLR